MEALKKAFEGKKAKGCSFLVFLSESHPATIRALPLS